MAKTIKKSSADIAVATVGGYLYPEDGGEIIAMARGWISNPDYGKLVYEDRSEDIVPCIRCNMCLRPSEIAPPTDKKRIAVIGGGPAGMKAALVAVERGHAVTLYEKSNALGGLFNTTDVYGRENTLAKKIVIIGGSEVGVETGLHLAENGHDVTVIEMLDKLATTA
jgi:flavanone/flavanol-cleaving reductase